MSAETKSSSKSKSNATIKKSKKFVPPKPFDDIKGKWVKRRFFKSETRNTFGYFTCNKCKKSWMSSRVKKKYKQACKKCESYHWARFLWLNPKKGRKNMKGKSVIDQSKEHIYDLCEACQNNDCSVIKTKNKNNNNNYK